jgi:heme/copper-type cytochrome/quinol oxidase subunit 1
MIGGTDYRPYMPYMLAICDYALIGEEIFIASAYVSDDPQLKNTIWVEDMMKLILLGLAVIGVLANLGGIEAFGTLLGS